MEEKQNILRWQLIDGVSLEDFLNTVKNDWKVKGIACVIPLVYSYCAVKTKNDISDGNMIIEALVVVNMHMIRSGKGDC
jgi:hypothetical protein